MVATHQPKQGEIFQKFPPIPAGVDIGAGLSKLCVGGGSQQMRLRLPSKLVEIKEELHDVLASKEGGHFFYQEGDRQDLMGREFLTGTLAAWKAPTTHIKLSDDPALKVEFALQCILGALPSLPHRLDWNLHLALSIHGEITGFEYQVYRQDGDIIWVSESARTVRDVSGQLLYYEGILEEVTQRKLEEEALKLQVKELRIEIDQTKRARQVAEITQSDYFLELQAEIENLQLKVDDDQVSEAVTGLVSEPATEPVRTVSIVLLVEDNRDMLSRRLQRSGYEVVIAVDGAEGVSKTVTEKPDIVLMDMSLPVLDGWEATVQLKANPKTRSIPVIALTAHAMSGDREKAFSAGCDEYDTKPINLSRLLGKIETLLEQAKSS